MDHFRDQFSPSLADISEANQLNARADEIHQEHPEMAYTDIVDDLIEEKRATTDLDEQLRESDLRSSERKRFQIAAWSEESPYATADLIKVLSALRLRSLGFTELGGLEKAILGTELGDRLEQEQTHRLPVVYLGSSSDVAFPLALRFRKIILVDPDINGKNTQAEIKELLGKIGAVREEREGQVIRLTAELDFGSGKEAVIIECNACTAEEYVYTGELPLGGLISYQSGGASVFNYPELYRHLAEGAVLYDNHPNIIEQQAWQELQSKDPKVLGKRIRELAAEVGLAAVHLKGVRQPYYTLIDNQTDWLEYADEAEGGEAEIPEGLIKSIPLAESFDPNQPAGFWTPESDNEE